MKVFVYFNLHKKCWSIKALEGPNKNKVIAHENYVVLENCKMKVSEAGRQRVLRERKKNVHAGIVGDWDEEMEVSWLYNDETRITYNPYKGPHFVNVRTKKPVHEAYYVVCGLQFKTGEGYKPLVMTD